MSVNDTHTRQENRLTNPETLPATMSVGECADALAVSRAGIYRAARLGAIPSVRVGRRVVISRDYVARLLEPLMNT